MLKLYSSCFVHNHDLCTSPEAALAGQQLVREGIPRELEDLGEMLSAAGISASQINQVLQINAQKQEMPITWTYKDVQRHHYTPSSLCRRACEEEKGIAYI